MSICSRVGVDSSHCRRLILLKLHMSLEALDQKSRGESFDTGFKREARLGARGVFC